MKLVFAAKPILLFPPPSTPWARKLDALEIWTAMSVAPWSWNEGLRVAEIERQLVQVATSLSLGAVYFQRVNRMVADLAGAKILKTCGTKRACRYLLTPEGFVSVVLNMTASFADPTVDASEFESKRMLAEIHGASLQLVTEDESSSGTTKFCDNFDQVRLLGGRIMSREIAREAFSIHALLDRQIAHVTRLHAVALANVRQAQAAVSSHGDPTALRAALRDAFEVPGGALAPEALRFAARTTMNPAAIVATDADVLRYTHQIEYLHALKIFYAQHAICKTNNEGTR